MADRGKGILIEDQPAPSNYHHDSNDSDNDHDNFQSANDDEDFIELDKGYIDEYNKKHPFFDDNDFIVYEKDHLDWLDEKWSTSDPKGKGVAIRPRERDDRLLFKKSKTREDDDLTILGAILQFLHHYPGLPPSPESHIFHLFVQRVYRLEPVKESLLRNRIVELRRNYRHLSLMPEAVAERVKSSSNLIQQRVFDLSDKIWSKEKGAEKKLFCLFRNSESGKDDYLTSSKFVHLYTFAHTGGFDRVKDMNRLHQFVKKRTGEFLSMPKLVERLWALEDYYSKLVKPSYGYPQGIVDDPKEKEVFYLIKSIWESGETSNAEAPYNTGPYDKRKKAEILPGFPYTTYLFNLNTKELCFEQPRHCLFKYSVTSRDDDVTMLQYAIGYILCCGTEGFEWDPNEFRSLFKDVILDHVSPNILSVRMMDLEINYRMLNAEHGDEGPRGETFVGVLDRQVYDLSQKIWGRRHGLVEKNMTKFGVAYWIENYRDFVISGMKNLRVMRPGEVVRGLRYVEEGELEWYEERRNVGGGVGGSQGVGLRQRELVNMLKEIVKYAFWDLCFQYEVRTY